MKARHFGAAARLGLVALAFLAGLAAIYFDTYSFRAARTVGNGRDPRWRVYDFHSRQATEGEIYNTAEVHVLSGIREVSPRRLRLEFKPRIRTASWKTVDAGDGRTVAEGAHPEIPFPDTASDVAVEIVPQDVRLLRPIRIVINFYPKESYRKKGLTWPDNYWLKETSIPVSTAAPFGVDAWAGIAPDDPDLREARREMSGRVDFNAPALARTEQVFGFVMGGIRASGGTPSDELQAASPLETARRLMSRQAAGFCENKSLVYYLFANAAGVATRLVDMAGKLGPVKLTGHYFCESWIPEKTAWMFVDPESGIAGAYGPRGELLHTVGLKKIVDAEALSACSYRLFDSGTGDIVDGKPASLVPGPEVYFSGYPVLAFKFGYGRNRSFSRIVNFIFYPTLLYAQFPLPRLYAVKTACATGFVVCSVLALGCLVRRKR